MARYKNKEELLNLGYQSMGIDDDDLEIFVKRTSEEEDKSIMFYYIRKDRTVWEYPKTVYLEDILLYNRMKEFLKL
jgi:hypothetical protein